MATAATARITPMLIPAAALLDRDAEVLLIDTPDEEISDAEEVFIGTTGGDVKVEAPEE